MTSTNCVTGHEVEHYEVRVQGRLDARWTDSFDELTFTPEPDGTTVIRAPLPDQTALHGLLNRIRDLGVPIVSVRRVGSERDRTNMRAIVQDEYGSPDVLRLDRIERPASGEGEVLLRVHAAAVDRGTWYLMAGRPYLVRLAFGLRKPKTRVPGLDVAGTVKAVGREVTGFVPGDQVFGTCKGSFAEYAVAHPNKLAHRPANLTFEQAAAVPISGLTALQAVRDHARVRPGQHVLVLGASGGVGTFAVQIAKAFGAEVTGVCSAAKADLVRQIGADHVLDYTRDEIDAEGRRYDAIIDIGGNRGLRRLRRSLTRHGRLVIVGGDADGRWIGGLDRNLRAMLLSPFVSQTLRSFISSENATDLVALRDLIESGVVTPVVDRTYPLSEVPEAIRHLEAGRARGKVVITM